MTYPLDGKGLRRDPITLKAIEVFPIKDKKEIEAWCYEQNHGLTVFVYKEGEIQFEVKIPWQTLKAYLNRKGEICTGGDLCSYG